MPQRDSESWSITLGRDADAPRAARHGLVLRFPDLPIQVRENALVAVTELVTNAVRFGLPPIQVRAGLGADLLFVEVSDEGQDRPHRRVPAEEGGIGLNLVFLLTDRVEIARDRSSVRCEFDMPAKWGNPSGPARYGLELVRQATTLRIVLRGEIDLTARPELDRLFAELDRSHPPRVVVDLREVTFFDSTGLQMAHRFDRWGRENGVTIVFTRGIPAVMLALRSAGLTFRLQFSDAPEDRLDEGHGTSGL
jgi:anti-anti-sigma factor